MSCVCKSGSDLKKYSKYLPDIRVTCVYGGTDIRRQMKELQKGYTWLWPPGTFG